MPSLVSLGGITGTYNSTSPVIINGQPSPFQVDVNGNLLVSLNTLIAGEDLTNNLIKVEQQYLTSGILLTDTLVKTGAGRLHTVTFSCNAATPTAGTIDVLDSTAAAGTPKLFSWTLTTAVFSPVSIHLDIPFSNGLFVDFTTTGNVGVVCSYR